MGTGQARAIAPIERKLKTNISGTHAALVAVPATCIMMAAAWWCGLREHAEPIGPLVPPDTTAAETAVHSNYKVFPNSNSQMFDAVDEPLATGNHIPSLDAQGWLNGEPENADLDSNVLVIDVWDGTCPYCSLAAPALIEANAKYRDKGVVFIGLTTASEDEARQYVDNWRFPWANGYNATATVDALKAHAPTLFVVAPDGRILWNDDRSRWHHEYANLGQQLESAIEDALAVKRKGGQGSEREPMVPAGAS